MEIPSLGRYENRPFGAANHIPASPKLIEQHSTQELSVLYNGSCTPSLLPTFGYGTWEACWSCTEGLTCSSFGAFAQLKLVKLILTILLLTCVSGLCCSTAAQVPGTAEVAATGTADSKRFLQKEPALTGDRRPLYRLRKSDVIDIRFTFSPEYDQAVTVQPDGFIVLEAAGTLFAEGLTLPEVTAAVRQAYDFMRDPEVGVTLKDFEKPSFLASGQLGHPGKYELRSRTTVTEGIAIAGGFTELSKHSQVVLFRRVFDGIFEAHVLNVKAMLSSRNLDEDLELKPGDMLYVPQNRISKIRKYLPASSLSTFFSPTQF